MNNSHVLSPESETGLSIFGSTTFFPFSTEISDPQSFTSFTVSSQDVLAETFSVQSGVFVIPSLTSVSENGVTHRVNFTIATIQQSGGSASRLTRGDSGSAPHVRIEAPVGQLGTLGPAITTFNNVAVSNAGQKADYDFWEGSVTVNGWTLGPISVSVLDADGVELDVVMVG